MQIIVGLGNPGSTYSETRHNIGFAAVDALAEECRITFRPGKGEYWSAGGTYENKEFVLIKPTTMMNNSGIAVRDILDRMQCTLHDLIIVYDDFHLPLGSLRFRQRGSDGGHNGMGSVIYHLQTEEIQRLRCGIGNPGGLPEGIPAADFVLSPFRPDERETARSMILSARRALEEWMTAGIEASMNRWNLQHEV